MRPSTYLLVLLSFFSFFFTTGFFKRTAPPPDPKDFETILRVQIFLDREHFGPGKLDGRLGEFTQKAATHYNLAHRIKPTNWYKILKLSKKKVKKLYKVYRIQEQDFVYIRPELPLEPKDQEAFDFMYYRSMLELLAERFHADERLIQKLNPQVRFDQLTANDAIIVPNILPFQIGTIKKFRQFTRDEERAKNRVLVDTTEKILSIYRNEHLLAAFPITPGEKKFVPLGKWEVVIMITTPIFRYDKQMLEQGKRGEEYYMIPPGPNSPVGILWTGLSKSGIGIHGTSDPEKIGRGLSAGCIRLSNWDAIRLPQFICPGSLVEVR